MTKYHLILQDGEKERGYGLNEKGEVIASYSYDPNHYAPGIGKYDGIRFYEAPVKPKKSKSGKGKKC